MSVGPIQLLTICFEDFRPTGRILPALNAAVAAGAIRVVDLQFVSKDHAGNINFIERSDLSPAEQIEFKSVISALIGGKADQEYTETEALKETLATKDHSHGLSAGDIQEIAHALDPGDAAGLLVIEHTWAIEFRDAVVDAGGHMIAHGFLSPDTLKLIGAELKAQLEPSR